MSRVWELWERFDGPPRSLLRDVICGLAFGLALTAFALVLAWLRPAAFTSEWLFLFWIATTLAGFGLALCVEISLEYEFHRNTSWFLRILRKIGFSWVWSTRPPPTEEQRERLRASCIAGSIIGGFISIVCGLWAWATSGWNWEVAGIFAYLTLVAGLLGSGIGWWRSAAKLGVYPRTRLLIGVPTSMVLSFPIAVIVIDYLMHHPDIGAPIVGHPTLQEADLLSLKLALIGPCIYLLWRRVRREHRTSYRNGRAAGGAGSAARAFFDVGHRLGAFAIGIMCMAAAGGLVAADLWWLRYQTPSESTQSFWPGAFDVLMTMHQGMRVVVYLVVAVVAFMGLREWRAAFKSSRRFENREPHGRSRTATEDEASDYERGGGGRGPIHDQRF
jgi:hypothetical protein